MPDLSQRTLAHVMRVLSAIVPQGIYTSRSKEIFWQQKLFEWGFPKWLIDYAEECIFEWTSIIRDLFDGKVWERTSSGSHSIPRIVQASMLKRLTALAITESGQTEEVRQLRRSLQLDGFDVEDGETIPIDGPISVVEEKSRLLRDLKASLFTQKGIIAKHLEEAEDLFSKGKMHPAMGEARSAFQAAAEDCVELMEKNTRPKSGGGFKNQVEFLTKTNFVSDDEAQALLAAWGFLSAGAHPGLPPDEAGRIGLVLALEFTHMLLVKAQSLS